MGKGDKKTAKGKRFAGSHGNVRKAGIAASSAVTVQPKKAVAKPAAKKAAAKKAPAKKAPAKKAAAKSE